MPSLLPIFHATDFYKVDHRRQYPAGTTRIYSNFTARGSRLTGIDHVINFGIQFFIKRWLIEEFDATFFRVPKDQAVAAYKRRLDTALGPDTVPLDHVGALHDLGYLPLTIRALPEGALVPLQVPLFTVENTRDEFFWLTNFIETMLSATVWGMVTSATVAFEYRKTFEEYAKKTGAPRAFILWQGHDFSMRGMFGIEAAAMSGAGHLLSFTGTDTIPAIELLERYYNGNANWMMVGGSVPATEHSVMCAGGKGTEEDTYRRLVTEVYPKGIVSVVSDTRDFWGVVTKILPKLKTQIMARDGKLVIRPDSGDPVKTLIGDFEAVPGSPEHKGLIECLWDIFGGTTTVTGHKVLDPHIGAIYGDSITIARQKAILAGLDRLGFASCNVVLGIGSYTYQYTTRDTFGMAMKSTYCEVNGVGYPLFKQPKTDSGKNSHKGLLHVGGVDGEYRVTQNVTRALEQDPTNCLVEIFRDGKMVKETTLKEIRARIDERFAPTEG